MPLYQSTYHSKTFRDFKEIESDNYRRIIHFYEEREDTIRGLEFDEYFELLIAYVNSLFEVGFHQKHLLMVDVAIEEAINNNVQYYAGEDIFEKLLFRKAASHYRCAELDRCDYVLRELIRINPYREDAILFLKKCLRRKEPLFLNRAKALSIFCFLLAAAVVCGEVLLVRPFYAIYTETVEWSRNGIFLFGCISLAGGVLLHRLRVERRVERFVMGNRE